MRSSWFNFRKILKVIKVLAILGMVAGIIYKRKDIGKIFSVIITSLMAILAKINPWNKQKK